MSNFMVLSFYLLSLLKLKEINFCVWITIVTFRVFLHIQLISKKSGVSKYLSCLLVKCREMLKLWKEDEKKEERNAEKYLLRVIMMH
jgi:hypothetical protein